MALSAWGLGRGQTIFIYFALAVLLVNIILTFTDQFGLFDFLTLVIDVVLLELVILIWRRSR